MHLAFADERVDDATEVVNHGVSVDAHDAGLRVDDDFADMAAVGMVLPVARIHCARLEAGVQMVGEAARSERRAGHLGQRDAAVGARYGEAAVDELQVGLGRLQQMGGDGSGFFDDAVCRHAQGAAGDHGAACRIGAAAEGHLVGVTLHELYRLVGLAQPLGHQLRIRGGVALAMGVGAGEYGHAAGRIVAQLQSLVETPTRLDVIGHGAAA